MKSTFLDMGDFVKIPTKCNVDSNPTVYPYEYCYVCTQIFGRNYIIQCKKPILYSMFINIEAKYPIVVCLHWHKHDGVLSKSLHLILAS